MTLEAIKNKLREIETDVAAVREALDELAPVGANGTNGKIAATPNEPAAEPVADANGIVWPPHIRFVDKKLLAESFTDMMRREGIAEVEPIGAVELQRLMLEDGIKPEDCILSRGIIEMREE